MNFPRSLTKILTNVLIKILTKIRTKIITKIITNTSYQDSYQNFFSKNLARVLIKMLTKIFAKFLTKISKLLSPGELSLVDNVFVNCSEAGNYWEYKAFQHVVPIQDSLRCCRMELFSHLHFFKEVDQVTQSQVPILAVTVVVILVFAIVVNCKYSAVHSRSSLAVALIVCVFVSIANGITTGKLLGVPFIALVALTPFIILGVGIDSGSQTNFTSRN